MNEQSEQTPRRRIYQPDEIFTTITLDEIKGKDNIDDLARYAVDTWKKSERYVKTSFGKNISWKQWYKKYIARSTM